MQAFLADHYAGQAFVKVMPLDAAPLLDQRLSPATTCNDTNRARSSFSAMKNRFCRGTLRQPRQSASGAAIQCMNLMLGMDEATGLAA